MFFICSIIWEQLYQPNTSLGGEQGTVYNLQQFLLVNVYTKVKKKELQKC